MDVIIFILLLFGVPAAFIYWFALEVFRFLRCPKEDVKKRKAQKGWMVMTFVCMAVVVGGEIAFFVILNSAMTHM